MSFADSSRGPMFNEMIEKIENLFRNDEGQEVEIEVIEGPDLICKTCPYHDGKACCHPAGNETEVRKWDKRILKESGLQFNQIIEVKKIKSLIKEKAPLNFCLTKCRHYQSGNCSSCVLPSSLKGV